MVFIGKNDDGISDVIGVILLVGLTVAVSAVTALFFFGFVQNVNRPYLIEITASRIDPNTISIMNRGGQDAAMLTTSTNPFTVTIGGVISTPVSGTLDGTIGSSALFNASPGARIIITGEFKDNSKHVLYDASI